MVIWSKCKPNDWNFGDTSGVPPSKNEDHLSGTDMYHHAKFHADLLVVAELSVTEH